LCPERRAQYSERKRLQRAQQNFKLGHLLRYNGFNLDGSYESVSLKPVEQWKLEATAEVLKKFPVDV
jgi:hypothetical protein